MKNIIQLHKLLLKFILSNQHTIGLWPDHFLCHDNRTGLSACAVAIYMLLFCSCNEYWLFFMSIDLDCLSVCSGLTSLSTLSVISRQCLVVTGSSMLTFIVLPHCGIRSQTLLPDTTSSHIIRTPERPVLVLPRRSECQAGSN